MSEIKVNSIKGVGASAAAVTVHNSDGTCTLASGSKLNNCTTDGTTNLTIADGNLIVGTSGHGIDFSAGADSSSTSNLLDEYEEGEYTPTLSNGQSYNTSYDRLRYTKIGRKVTITGMIVLNAYNSSSFSSELRIGLPFNNGDGGDRAEYLFQAGIGYFNSTGSSSPSNGYQAIGFYLSANTSTAWLIAINPNTDTTIGNWVGAGSDIWLNITYFTD